MSFEYRMNLVYAQSLESFGKIEFPKLSSDYAYTPADFTLWNKESENRGSEIKVIYQFLRLMEIK